MKIIILSRFVAMVLLLGITLTAFTAVQEIGKTARYCNPLPMIITI